MLTLLIGLGSQADGVDLSTPHSIDELKCLVNNGYSFLVMRGYRSNGSIDPNAVQTLVNAKAAGFKTVDTYLFPCRGKSATEQADELVAKLVYQGKDTYETVWIDVETNPSAGCSWSANTATENCQFMNELVNALKAKGKKVGIYASYYMWQTIMGSPENCKSLSSLPLWYAHYDSLKAFSDFKPFGGWTTPKAKQYKGTSTVCQVSVDLDWMP